MTGKLKEVFGIYINDRRQQGEGMSAQEYRRIIAVELVFDYVNENTAENIANYGGTDTRKIFAHEYIDDKAINPVREAMWARRVRQLYAQRIISAVGLAAALVIAIEAALAFIK